MASDNHQIIVANVSRVLGNSLYEMPNVRIMGSNKLKGQEAGITNPYLLVEVHSDSTYKEDMHVKLRCYKQLESVQYIIYFEQNVPFVSVYTKQQDSRHWLNEDYDTLDIAVNLGDFSPPIHDICHK